jgi:hypothetical protein
MSIYHNDNTAASDSIKIHLSENRLRRIQPELFTGNGTGPNFRWGERELEPAQIIQLIREHISLGDSRAAVVVFGRPVIVAAYTDEIDCVTLLLFPEWLREEYQLRAGSHLLTVNTYGRAKENSPDLVPGPAKTNRWTHFYPIIAEFVSNDMELIERRKAAIAAAEWERTLQLGKARLCDPNVRIRDGRPLLSRTPGRPVNERLKAEFLKYAAR